MGLYLTGFYNTSWVMAMSLVLSNTAGATKKSFTAVSLAICYAIGNIIGPHFFLDSQKPYYELGIGTMMVAFVIMVICGGLNRSVVVPPLLYFRSFTLILTGTFAYVRTTPVSRLFTTGCYMPRPKSKKT
jgi:hypothetical protein